MNERMNERTNERMNERTIIYTSMLYYKWDAKGHRIIEARINATPDAIIPDTECKGAGLGNKKIIRSG